MRPSNLTPKAQMLSTTVELHTETRAIWTGPSRTSTKRSASAPNTPMRSTIAAILTGRRARLDRAIADYDRTLRLNPKNANAFYNRGITYRDKGDLDRALADFNAAIRLGPTDPDGYFGRGSVHERNRDYEAALVDYETALKINARHANALKGSDRVRALVQQR